jgi:Domain of unknown function (DUF4328)
MLDVWVCSSCHSINRERATNCYKCDAPRSDATGEGAGMRPRRAIIARITSPYRSTVELALLAALFILILVGLEIWNTVLEADSVAAVSRLLGEVAGGAPYDEVAWQNAIAIGDQLAIPTLAAFGVALVAFAGWLSLCVGNIPALGGGDPPVAPLRAFVYSLIPVYNFRKVPRLIQEVLYRVDPRGGGIFLVGLAWIGLVGSWLVGRFVGIYVNARIEFDAFNADSVAAFAASTRGLLDIAFAVDVLTTGLITLGSLALIVIIAEVERRAVARNREIEAELGAIA